MRTRLHGCEAELVNLEQEPLLILCKHPELGAQAKVPQLGDMLADEHVVGLDILMRDTARVSLGASASTTPATMRALPWCGELEAPTEVFLVCGKVRGSEGVGFA